MTENDLHLIELAQSTRTDWAYIDSLIPRADTDECRRKLEDLSHWAFKADEYIAFDRD